MAADYKTLYALVQELTETLAVQADRDRDCPPEVFEIIKRGREATLPSQPKSDPKILHFQPFDQCCSAPFRKAAVAGRMDKADDWSCPKCGSLWKVTVEDGVRKWAAQPAAMVFKV